MRHQKGYRIRSLQTAMTQKAWKSPVATSLETVSKKKSEDGPSTLIWSNFEKLLAGFRDLAISMADGKVNKRHNIIFFVIMLYKRFDISVE